VSPHKISCIIPVFNEGNRLLHSLTLLSKITDIAPVVIVDDGSTTPIHIQNKEFPDVQIIHHKKNKGKTDAIRTGVQACTTPYVLLLDADITGEFLLDLQNGIEIIKQNESIDMLIFRRITSPFFVQLMHADMLLSGERIIKRTLLNRVLATPIQGFQLELALNKIAIEEGFQVLWAPSNASNTFKIEKLGFKRGMQKELTAYRELLGYDGLLGYLKQVFTYPKLISSSLLSVPVD
jgi:glycosyltransferase involved in cell wall biosynthesis